jgi:hypothetical protein
MDAAPMTHTSPGTGVVTLYEVAGNGAWRPRAVTRNTWLYTWGYMAAQALGLGNAAYKIGAAYLEYENVAAPADPVSIPPFQRQDGLEYYANLAASPVRDFLRLPLIVTPAIGVVPGFEDYFAAGQGNQLTVFVQSAGTAGFFGKTFSDTVNSKVCGIALVAIPIPADQTQDVLFSRAYYQAADQVLKTPSGQVGIQYTLGFQ